jgi:hypothetical protein
MQDYSAQLLMQAQYQGLGERQYLYQKKPVLEK